MAIKLTLFNNHHDTTGVEKSLELAQLAELISGGRGATKTDLPMLKLAQFGDVHNPDPDSSHGLRWDGNVKRIVGVELDYDGEQIAFTDVIATLRDHGVSCIAYTSPSYTADKPRWRVLFPLSRAYQPHDRKKWAMAADGLIGKVAAEESFNLGLCYYYGQVRGVDFHIETIYGTPLDKLELSVRSYGGWLELIGDHTGGAGFYNPIKSAIAAYIGHHKTAEGLMAELEPRIRSADRSRHEASYIDRIVKIAGELVEWTLKKEAEKPKLRRNRFNEIIAGQHNLLHVLELQQVALSYDEFADRYFIAMNGRVGEFDDKVSNELRLAVDRNYHFLVGKDLFNDITNDVAHQNRFHPVKDYLDGLAWDGVERLPTWLADYVGAEKNDYTCAVGELHMIAAVRRIRQPGCEKHEMLVLVDPTQGSGKSEVIKALCPNLDWFCDSVPVGADDKIVIERLRGKWIAECAELAGMRNSDIEKVKAFVSKSTDTSRLAYGRRGVSVPRQSVFFGSTNTVQFLRDETGNRRFWPIVIVGKIDPPAVRELRDQLWAEAAYKEAQGVSHKLPEALWAFAAAIQEKHRMPDAWEITLEHKLADVPAGKVQVLDLWNVLGMQKPEKQRSWELERLSSAMTALGWASERLSWGKGKSAACFWKGERERKIIAELSGFSDEPNGDGNYILCYEQDLVTVAEDATVVPYDDF